MRRWLGSILSVVIAVGVSVGGGAQAFARTGDPTPVVHGGAFVRAADGDDFAPATEGAAVVAGNGVRSSPTRPARLDIADGVSLRLAPGTTLIVRSASWLPAEHPGAMAVRALQLSMLGGEIDISDHDPKGAIGVTILLPGGRSVSLWRGSANVTLDGTDKATVALYEGMAIAGAGTKWQPLSSGKGAVFGAKEEISTHPIPGKTDWSTDPGAPPSFVLVRGSEGGVVGAAWSAAEGAGTYRIELAKDAEMTGDETVTSAPGTVFHSDPLGAGSFALRVRAISPDGIVGPMSTTTMLRVAHISLPKGAFAAPDGNVVMADGTGLDIDDPRDLEVATVIRHDMPDDALFWTPASTKIMLGSGDRREIRIRHAPSHTKTSFVLVRRTLRAHISFAPKPARWPANPIDITVKVEDPSGYIDAAREAITVDARLDIDPMNLQWQHNGDTWTARVPPQTSGGGPWVIRVDVKDSAGVSIGASLCDIDGPASARDPALQQAVFRN